MPFQYRIGSGSPQTVSPLIGCIPVFIALTLMCLLPMFLYDTARFAFERLGLSPGLAAAVVLGIVIGSVINLPVYALRKDELQPQSSFGPLSMTLERTYRRVQSSTVIAVNVGGCVIPVMVATLQLVRLMRAGEGPVWTALMVSGLSIVVCWKVARPMEGIGILIPGYIPPLVSVLGTWLLLPAGTPDQRAATAFLAGVTGPLIGADLLHLRDMTRTPVAVVSIGGAGTFDGIVLSGVLAALWA